MSPRTLQLFEKPKQKRRVLMHVTDAGFNCAGSGQNAKFKCVRCGYETGWLQVTNVTEAKRGVPCPECNK